MDGIPVVIEARRPDGNAINVPPDKTDGSKALYLKDKTVWEISEDGYVSVKTDLKPTGINGAKLADALDFAEKNGIQIPEKVRQVAINAYGVAPLLAPMKINPSSGMVEPEWETGYRGQPMSIPGLLKEFASND